MSITHQLQSTGQLNDVSQGELAITQADHVQTNDVFAHDDATTPGGLHITQEEHVSPLAIPTTILSQNSHKTLQFLPLGLPTLWLQGLKLEPSNQIRSTCSLLGIHYQRHGS